MSSKTILGIAAVACSPLLALADSGFALGPDTKLHLTADGQVRFDDNVLLSDSNKDGDTIFVVAPGAELNYDGGISKGVVTLAEQFIRYADHGTLDGDLFSANGEYAYEGALTKVNARAGYSELSQGSVRIRNREESIRHNVTNASLDGLWSATAKTRIGAGIAYDATTYPGSGYYDSQNFSLPVDIYFAATPKVDVSVGYRYRESMIDEPHGAASMDSTDHFFNVGARGEFTPKLNGQVRVGYGVRDFDEAGSEGQVGLSGALTYAYSPKTSFDLSVSNDFSNSVLGTSQEIFAVRAGGKFEFTPQWSSRIGLSYESSDYAKVAGSGYTNGRKDDFVVGDATVVYAMNENVSFQGSYIYRTNSSNRPGLDFNSNLLSLGVSLRY